MEQIKAIVYDPPTQDYPHVAVVFGSGGDVLMSKVVPSREEGESFLSEVMSAVQAQVDAFVADAEHL